VEIAMRAYESDEFTIAVAVRAASDDHSPDAVGICDVACGPFEAPDLVHHVARSGVAGQPLDMPVQESSECWDVSRRRRQPAFAGDKAGP